MSVDSWIHRHVSAVRPDVAPLLLLHGTDGGENDLLDFGQRLAPDAAKLSPRGTVATDSGMAFIRRLPDRRVDVPHLEGVADGLDELVADARRAGLLPGPPIAVGYSSGAITAAGLLLRHPAALAGAVLLRPLDPFDGDVPAPDLGGVPVLVVAGAHDRRRVPEDATRTADRLARAGAAVTTIALPVGHAIVPADLAFAATWLRDAVAGRA